MFFLINFKSNMIISSDTIAPWSDAYYPSAKAVADRINAIAPGKIEHPIGSVLITSTNVNPGTSVGGTWELVDKEFKSDYVDITMNWSKTIPGYVAAGVTDLTWGKMMRNGHTIFLQLWLTINAPNTVVSLNPPSSVNLGVLSRAACGLNEAVSEGSFIVSAERDIVMAITPDRTTQAGTSQDPAYYPICYDFRGDGLFSIRGITEDSNSTTLPDGTLICINTAVQANWKGMLDSACDKFYWKRTK